MQLHRNFRLATTKGHSVQFEANQPTYVPPTIVAEAIAIGAEMAADDSKPDMTPVDAPAPNSGPADAAAREADILAAINVLVQRNDREDFTGGGLPKLYAVAALLGYKTDRKELEAVWLKRAEMIVAGLLGPDGEKA
jgi:hypothetical protein